MPDNFTHQGERERVKLPTTEIQLNTGYINMHTTLPRQNFHLHIKM